MYIFIDIISGDEMFTDAGKIEEIKVPEKGPDGEMSEVATGLFKVHGKLIMTGGGIDNSLIGGNASAEGGCDDGTDDNMVSVCNLVSACKLQETQYVKKDFVVYFKAYVKRLVAKLEIESDKKEFKESAPKALKYILAHFKDYQFFTSEKMDPDASLGFMNYEEDGVTPYMLFFKQAYRKQKL